MRYNIASQIFVFFGKKNFNTKAQSDHEAHEDKNYNLLLCLLLHLGGFVLKINCGAWLR